MSAGESESAHEGAEEMSDVGSGSVRKSVWVRAREGVVRVGARVRGVVVEIACACRSSEVGAFNTKQRTRVEGKRDPG